MSALPRLPTGYTLRAHESLPSTNDEAKRLAGEGAPHGLIVWAREQTSGRGRRGRSWTSPAGNLYASFLLRLAIPADRATQAGFVAALSLAETAEAFLPRAAEVRCKWPNDLLVNTRKAAGILLESAPSADGRLDWLVLGCGLNLVSHPADSRWPATDLAAEGGSVPAVPDVLVRLVSAMNGWLGHWQRDGFAAVRDAWLARGYRVGEILSIAQGGKTLAGRFLGLGEDGALLLDRGVGPVEAVHSGEVSLTGR